ncbi:MAG: hypothetical protein CM15mP63_4550 [Gammaproteobacteria bacterium]|nr:MAG: hypothetical protein CM15mP63_4550 [Gammaproteobacteria bacterium]
MPTASTAQILGNNSCFEALQSNIYKRKTQAGEFKLVNKYLIKDLKNLGNWNEDIKNNIIYNNGSVNELDIPKELKDLYKIVWEDLDRRVLFYKRRKSDLYRSNSKYEYFYGNIVILIK